MTSRAWWQWFIEEAFPMWVAWRLPKQIALWAFIRVYIHDGHGPSSEYCRIHDAWMSQGAKPVDPAVPEE